MMRARHLNSSWTAALLVAAATMSAFAPPASATPPNANALGFKARATRADHSVSLDLSVRPSAPFDGVLVEAGSGVASLSPACSFTAVKAGESHACRVTVTGVASEPTMTMLVHGVRPSGDGPVPALENHRVTVRNPSFDRSQVRHTPSRHVVGGTPPANR